MADFGDRSVITIRGDGFFDPGSASVSDRVLPLLARIAEAGNGVVVLLRQQEPPAELAGALRAAASAQPQVPQPDGPGTGGEGAVLRTFGVGAQILKDLGVKRMRVLSAPKQMHGISAFDLEIEGYVGEEG